MAGVLAALLLATAAGQSAAAECRLMRVAELPVTMDGLWPTVTVKVNGKEAVFVADSGAFFSMVTPSAAERFHMHTRALPMGFYLKGATGEADARLGVADTFTIANGALKGTEFLVSGDGLPDVDGLLGQNVLGVFDTEYDLANGVIRLWKADGCGDAMLAYWGKDVPVSALRIGAQTPAEPHITAEGQVNGHEIRVLFDTGGSVSGLKLSSARRIGLSLDAPGVRAGGVVRGVGKQETESWIIPVESFAIGDETIKHTQLRVAREDVLGADMLLGGDFFLSHRVLVAHSQRRLYFSYNGGPVFRLGQQPGRAAADAPPQPPAATPTKAETAAAAAEPGLDAAALVRRAKASEVRGAHASAIADLTRAIELEPADAQHVYDRALIRMRARQPVLAMADLDQALKLKPDFTDALLLRGGLRLVVHDAAGADGDLAAALKAAAGKPHVVAVVAEIYGRAGRFDRAMALYDQAIAAEPRDSQLLNARCWARALWGRELDKALADCDAAIRIGPRRSAVLDSRGLVHLRRGEFDLAIADYDAALKMQPKQAWSLFGRGLAKAKKGDAAGSAADLSAAEELAPDIRAEAKRLGLTEETVVALQAP